MHVPVVHHKRNAHSIGQVWMDASHKRRRLFVDEIAVLRSLRINSDSEAAMRRERACGRLAGSVSHYRSLLRFSRLRVANTITARAIDLGMSRDELDGRKSLYALVCWQRCCKWELTLWRSGS